MTSKNEPTFPMEPIRLIGLLVRLQDDLSYMGECISDDLTGEAKHAMFRTLAFVDATTFPLYIKTPVIQGLADIDHVLRGNRDLVLCRRRIQDLRRRLANEVALRAGLALPYSAQLYPTFTDKGSNAS